MPQAVQDALAAGVPFPGRMGTPADYPKLVKHIVENEMLNGEVIRLDGRYGWHGSTSKAGQAVPPQFTIEKARRQLPAGLSMA